MAKKMSGDGWSFEPGGAKAPEPAVSLPPNGQVAKIKLEKRAKGKEVTAVTGFVLSDADRKALASTLRKKCGSGGSDSPDCIEVQGDHRQAVAAHLQALGWRVK